ncbi:O-antigen ligase family protein [Clostridium cuniculi]|uniref:O-antigen ligase family protein n=1 Tax=Clostridium cuniculi TaxID=2548455 RepID=UPI0010561DE6|nr:O-antigen ligase family protein [Clostridium cuniculi]
MNIIGLLTRLPLYYILFRGLYGRYIINRFVFMIIVAMAIFPLHISLYKRLKLYRLSKETIMILFGIISFWISFLTIGNRHITTNLSVFNFTLEVPIIIGGVLIVVIMYNLCNQSLYDEIWWVFFILWLIVVISIGKEFFLELAKNPSTLPRIKGTYGNANQTALFLNLYLISIMSYIQKDSIYIKILPVINYLTGVCILLTLSRSGMISFALINILFFDKSILKKRKELLKGVLILSIAIISVILLSEKSGLYLHRWSLSDGAGSNGRLEAVVSGIRIFLKNPLFGVGLDRAVYYSVMYGAPIPLKPHNTIVLILAETGIFPAFILVSLIMYIVWITYKYKFINTFRLTLLLLVMSMFNHNLHLYTSTWVSLILIIIYDFRNLREG